MSADSKVVPFRRPVRPGKVDPKNYDFRGVIIYASMSEHVRTAVREKLIALSKLEGQTLEGVQAELRQAADYWINRLPKAREKSGYGDDAFWVECKEQLADDAEDEVRTVAREMSMQIEMRARPS